MARQKKSAAQVDLLQAAVTTAPAVPLIREAVRGWKEGGYRGISDTTRALLNFWFPRDGHRRRGIPGAFKYHPFQQDAIETLIYLYEAEKVRTQKALLETFVRRKDIQLLQHGDFARYCLKMATGTGKTKVMSLAIAWQFFNAVAEGDDDFARTFLILAPNVIVYERLHTDFANGKIFREDPIIPPELKIYWEFDCYMRGDGERAASSGALYLTNIQQLHDRPEPDDEPDPMTAVLGPKPKANAADQTVGFRDRVVDRGGRAMVVNDEAHHTHDEKLKWNEIIRGLEDRLTEKGGGIAQLDVTATPRYGKGGELFTWTVFDYPLKQAIIDGIVKKPIKGLAVGIKEGKSEHASQKYKAYLTAGVERWKEYRKELAPLGKKPILFIMMNSTEDADDVAEALRSRYPEEFEGEKLLVIHTNNVGEVSRKDEEPARKAAREVDSPTSPVNAIVSVLMLREGWDVQNVTVIIGLRPFSAKANILPEQALGRGLRLMFRGQGTGYQERVDVIGTNKFMELVDQLEKDEDLKLEQFELGKDHLVIQTIVPDPAKMDKDIEIPTLTPILVRKKTLAEEIAALDVTGFAVIPEGIKAGSKEEQTFRYEGYDVISMAKIFEREYRMPEPQTVQEVIGYYARKIAQDIKLPTQFAALAPKVKEYFAKRAFGRTMEIEGREMIGPISSNVAQYMTLNAFGQALRKLVVEQQQPRLEAGRKLSSTAAFPYSRKTFKAGKTVFNLVTCDNEFEGRFARFLQDAPDVVSFAKLPSQFGFAIEYTDSTASLRYYEPDFVAVLADGSHRLIETKGREDPDVAHKDRAARLWCENASALTPQKWGYLKVPQAGFEKLEPKEFVELGVFEIAPS